MTGKLPALRRVRAISAGFGLLLGAAPAPVAAAADSDLAFILSIDVGRLETMVSKAEEVVQAVAGRNAIAEAKSPEQAGDATLGELREVVLRYNRLVEAACRDDRLRGDLCARPYLPQWLNDPPGAPRDLSRLRTMVRDASASIRPFWDAACARGKTVLSDERFCELE